jgi:drug/metabolite transporter (DMT)-like permease
MARGGRRVKVSRGALVALLSAALFGVSTPFAKRLVGDLPPVLLAGLLYVGSGAGLGIFRVLRPGARGSFSRREMPWLAGAILFGGVLAPVLLMIGLRSTPAAAASLLLNLEGVFTALLAWFVFHENFDRRIAVGMVLIVAGGGVLSWQPGGSFGVSLGALLVVAACACWAIDNNLTQKVSAADPVTIAATKGSVAGVINVAIALALGASLRLPAAFIVGALLVGLVGYGLSLALFVVALRHLGTARTGAYFSVAPFVGAAVSLVLFREPMTPGLLTAGLLMGAGVWLHLSERHEHEHHHELLTHTHRHVHDEHHHHEHAPGVDPREPHTHPHEHEAMTHAHPHYPDIHHRHRH